MNYSEAVESKQNLKEAKEDIDEKVQECLKKLVEKKAEIVSYENDTLQLEENIYELSICNYSRLSTREKLLEVLPEIVYQVKTEKN